MEKTRLEEQRQAEEVALKKKQEEIEELKRKLAEKKSHSGMDSITKVEDEQV